jgi:hypothetical protein
MILKMYKEAEDMANTEFVGLGNVCTGQAGFETSA